MFDLSDRGHDYRDRLLAFMDEHVYPAESVYREQMRASGDANHHPQVLEDLKAEARRQGLWNLFHPHPEWGPGLTNLEYAHIAEITGRSIEIAPEAINCNAPDTGNMEVLTLFGTDEHKERYLASGVVAERLAATRTERDAALATRALPITGTSTFPLAGETLLTRTPRSEPTGGLPRRRDSEVFEDLRERTAAGDVSVPVIALGPAKEHTARLTFVTNLLGVAGIRPDVIEVADESTALDAAQGARVAVVASSAKGYAAHAEASVASLRSAGVGRVLVAGRATEVGDTTVDGEVRDGMDVVAFLTDLLDTLGAPQAGAQA